jgi:hypothetical protein
VVVVGNRNASPRTAWPRVRAALGLAERVYFAEASYAAGVLEGCRRFGIM